MMVTDHTISVPALARAVEERGFDSLYLPEHTHIPMTLSSKGLVGDGVVGEEYARTPDPLVSLAAAAAVTERILLGTGVSLVAQHDPIVMAKQLATLDQLAAGRVVLGVGYGWNRAEIENHGVAFASRRERVREHLLLMQALWADDVAAFDGAFVHLTPSRAWPKPVQRPRVRTLIGGQAGTALFGAIAEHADGWMPLGGGGLKEAVPALRAVVADVGRDPMALHIVPFGTVPDQAKLDHFRSLGVTEVILSLPAGDEADTCSVLDGYTQYLQH
jgi:probable F420-dependent oxidoreductase